MTEQVRNPFVGVLAAQSYRHGRPFHHERALQRIRSVVGDVPSSGRGLDVACGTGMSAVALAQIVDEVVAYDVDASMVAAAQPHERTQYLVASAEQMPVPSSSVDVVTVASALHWFHPGQFFSEARRVLEPEGWLWVYDHYFTAELVGDPEFKQWTREVYLSRYPTPQRGPRAEAHEPAGFAKVGEDAYQDPIVFSHERLVDYLLTQSNIVTVVSEGRESEAGARAWLTEQTRPFFSMSGEQGRRFLFRGTAALWQRRD